MYLMLQRTKATEHGGEHMATKTLVLFNGGLKSVFLAALAKHEGEAVLCYIDSEQEQAATRTRVAQLAEHLGMVLLIVPLPAAPPLRETLIQMLYLTLHALPYAKSEYCKCIYHGLSQDDDPHVVGVLDQYVKQLGDLIMLAQPLYDGKGGWLGSVELETPLRRLDRGKSVV